VSKRLRLIGASVAIALAAGLSAEAQVLQPLSLQGDPDRGQGLAYTCSGCHGIEGAVNAYPTYHVPKLGGQNPDYIEIALQGYRDGSRSHQTMHAQAMQLSDQDIADLSAYFAGIEAEAESGVSSASSADIAAGQEKSITCQACHGAAGIAQSEQWPNLAGQHASYLLEAMLQYQGGERTAPSMAPLVSQLDEQTLAQIAAFYASQAGLHGTGR
jgi:cytochrome c553